LILDEPTSGLDSTTSIEVLGYLQKLSKTGMTIASVIHQPRYEIYEMFDDVLLLGKGGKVVYQGPGKDALDYFVG
jgi:ABC-type multidrug transport system ATPase subunit